MKCILAEQDFKIMVKFGRHTNMTATRAKIRIDENEVANVTEEQFENLLTNYYVIFTQNGKDVAISVPYEEYKEQSEILEKALENDGNK